jgi:hypothetical protein
MGRRGRERPRGNVCKLTLEAEQEAISDAVSHGISSMVSGFSALVGGSAKMVNSKGVGQVSC